MAIFNSPHRDIALTGQTITERVFQGLEGRGSVPVLIEGSTGRSLSAEDLTDRVRRLAGGLTARGYGAGATVALMAPNLPEFAVVFYGVTYAGGTITTINPTYTKHELHHQLADSGARLLIVVPELLDCARDAVTGTNVAEIAVIGAVPGCLSLDDLMGVPLAAQHPVDVQSHVAVLPYSSGTTGLPKGVMLTHRNLVANLDQFLAVQGVIPGEWAIAFLPFFHIYGQTVLMNLYLAAGAGVVTMPRFDLAEMLRLSQAHRTRRIYCVPPVVVALAKHPMVEEFDLGCVETIMSGAAPLGPSTSELAAARLGATALQGYGMTELSPVSHLVPEGALRAGAVGFPLPNTECRIVDPATLTDLDAGGEGELWIRGPQVMKGYHDNPEATARTLTEDGWLRTGDLAEIDADGYFWIRDRLKELIKVKGFQVAPAELEEALLDYPGIRDAAVIGVPDDEAGERPAAFVVAAPGVTLTEAEVLAHMADRLAHYKHLARVTFVEAIPKSASGKILRRLLRAQAHETA